MFRSGGACQHRSLMSCRLQTATLQACISLVLRHDGDDNPQEQEAREASKIAHWALHDISLFSCVLNWGS